MIVSRAITVIAMGLVFNNVYHLFHDEDKGGHISLLISITLYLAVVIAGIGEYFNNVI